ncbi:hypothetical protein Ndes2437B_g04802 [Nannochloris sp. 'desiccata']
MSLRWLPIVIATMMSTIIVTVALLSGSIVRGGGWRGQGGKYTVSISKSIRTINSTGYHAEQMKTQQTTTSKKIFVSPSRPLSSPSTIESNSKPLDKISSASTSKTANDGDYVASKVTLMGSLNGTGTFTRVRYRFDNVFLETENLISVHLPASVPLPTKPLLVDGVHGAPPIVASATEPPTVFYHRDINQRQEHYLNISYTHISISQQDEHLRKEPLRKCTRWETRPVYLMYVPHPYNVWHVYNDALMGLFQTLREEGHLPLAEIDEAGNMVEYLEGLDPKCQWKLDLYGNGSAYRPEKCLPKTGRLPNSSSSSENSIKCSPKNDEWCRPGLVAFNRSSGPIILLAKGAIWPDRKWRHMFTAISEDIREWDDMVGACFKELFVVKSHTLNFYTAIFSSYPNYPHAQKQRVGGMQAFQELMTTAERHHREVRHIKKPKLNEWGGYSSSDLEILRQGIGPENIGALSVLRDIRTAGIEEGRLKQKDVEEINRMRREETEDMLAFVREKQQMQEEEELRSNARAARKQPRESAGVSAYPQSVPAPSAPRPVVTFMWRMDFKRCAVNEADILTYLLLRYNVTVRVTTFSEPLMETMDLMNSTDILLGMHGAGWTNAIFLKRGAAAMQMHPYSWKDPATKRLLRGGSYKAIIKAKEAQYVEWVNPFANYSFLRPTDFDSMARRGDPVPYKYSLHPDPGWKVPYAAKSKVGSVWIYQNTLVKIRDIAVKLDTMMELKGIMPMPVTWPVVVEPVTAVSEVAAAAELAF